MSGKQQNGHLEVIFEEIRDLLSDARNPARAAWSEAYMKGHFRYFGMPTEERRAVQKHLLTALNTLTDREERWQLIRKLWEGEEREFQYVAIDWLNSWPKKWLHASDGAELEYLISTKSWWDSVDAIATNYLHKWELQFPKEGRTLFEQWRYSGNIWLQRSCLIYQLKRKNAVNTAYLESLIAQLLPQKEFFIQKAIGWSLRQLSKYEPETVRHILENHPVKGLALREAKKYLPEA